MRASVELGSADTDNLADEQIEKCLDPEAPRSFFLYAGAGSGKTRSLVEALKAFRGRHEDTFRRSARQIAVITYTNAACDEIFSRVDEDALFVISTIHSFCWSQIGTFHSDIQDWVKSSLPNEITELEEKEARGRAGTQASIDRQRSIAVKRERLDWLSTPRRFTYNPNGDNFGAASLSHTEVLKITADFITSKPSMQALLVNRFPFLLIDESQDTNRELMDAFFVLEEANQGRFALGLFGDMMQRIYGDGKPDLGQHIPARWATPQKRMNHRCPQRIIALANALRQDVDQQLQTAREDSAVGIVRLFIAPADVDDKPAREIQIRRRMAEITDDEDWDGDPRAVKTLALEHRMSAIRMGFEDMFAPLYSTSQLNTGLLNGSLPGLRLFSERVRPLVTALRSGDHYGVMTLLREKKSPLLKREVLATPEIESDPLSPVKDAVAALEAMNLGVDGASFLEVLHCVAKYRLFDIPDSLEPFTREIADADVIEEEYDQNADEPSESASTIAAWRDFLETRYHQINAYAEYMTDTGAYDTHQGVKGREFSRVLIVIDDSEARGFLFSYEKLFGVRAPSAGDLKKLSQGEETGMDRTRRLFYVTCTRAEKSLALVAYTADPDRLERSVTETGWFDQSEIVHI